MSIQLIVEDLLSLFFIFLTFNKKVLSVKYVRCIVPITRNPCSLPTHPFLLKKCVIYSMWLVFLIKDVPNRPKAVDLRSFKISH